MQYVASIRRRRGASTKMPETEKMPWFATLVRMVWRWIKKQSTVNRGDWKKWSFGFKAPRSFGWIWLCLRVPFCTKLTTAPDKIGFGLLEAFYSTFFPTEVLLRVTLPGRTIMLHKTKNQSQFSCCVCCDGALNPRANFNDGWFTLVSSRPCGVKFLSGLVGRKSAPTLPRGWQVTNHGHRCSVDGGTAWKKSCCQEAETSTSTI